jgi:hypothetical protein
MERNVIGSFSGVPGVLSPHKDHVRLQMQNFILASLKLLRPTKEFEARSVNKKIIFEW